MNVHINDYNFLISLMPEIEIYNTIIQYIDNKETVDNFLIAFPVLKLFCKHDNYIYINEHINVYESNNINFGSIKDKSYLLIVKNVIFKISNFDTNFNIISCHK